MSQEEYRNEGRRPAQSRSGHGGRRVAPSHPEGERRSAPRRRKKRLGGWGVLLYVIFVLGISALLAGVGWIWANDVLALNKPALTAVVEIDEGDTVGQVADKLEEQGLIEYKMVFKLFCSLTHTSGKAGEEGAKITPGTYELNTDMDYRALISSMGSSSANRMTTTVTIPEGMTEAQITEAYKILKAKGAKNFGIHAFLASNTVTNEYYPILAKILFELAVKLKKETGADFKFINLSGGIGIPYRPDQEPNDIKVIGESVRKVYEEVLVPAGMGDVAIFTELGRFMLAPYGALVTRAIHEKHTYKEYIGVDACAVNLMRPAMYGAYHHITVMGKENEPCDHKYDVTGSLCENNDKFAIDRMLPKIDKGDLLFIHDAGAHGFAMGYNYNGKLKSAELLLKEDGSVQMIRRAETPKDYFATFDFCDILKNVKNV